MKKYSLQCLLALTLSCALANAAAESRTAIADDGREVLLNDNGEWEYASDDLFATTPEGDRIRLQQDGRWQRVRDDEAPAWQPAPLLSRQQDTATLAESELTLVLDQVEIENKRESVSKNTRLRSNLVFYLEVSPHSALSLNPEQVTVQDNRGRDYPVFLVEPGTARLGGQPRWVIRANGAPRWWGVKFFSLQIAPGSLGNAESIDLRKPMADVISREVDSLPD